LVYEPKDMTFSLFPNKDKKTDKHPNLTGTAIINGDAYFIDGWTNVDRNGNKYIAGKLKPKQALPEPPHLHRDAPPGREELDDEVPF
jgi:uncharacterized protein (DUF736 family)